MINININIKEEDIYFQQKKIIFTCSEHPECEKQAICVSEKHPFSSRFICIKCILKTKDLDIQSKTFFIKDLFDEPKAIFENILSNPKIEIKKSFCQGLNELKEFFLLFQGILNNKLLIFQQQYDQLNNAINCTLDNLEKELKIHEFKHQLIQVLGKENHLQTKEYQKLEDILQSVSNINKKFQENFDIKKFQAIERELITTIDDLNVDIQSFCDFSLQYLKTMKEKFVQSLDNGVMLSYPELHQQISLGKQVKYEQIYQGTKDGMKLQQDFWQIQNSHYNNNLLIIMEADCGKQFGGFKPQQQRYEQYGLSLESFLFSYSNGKFSICVKKNNQPKLRLGQGRGINTNDCANLRQIFDFNDYEIQDTNLFEGKIDEFQIFKVKMLH